MHQRKVVDATTLPAKSLLSTIPPPPSFAPPSPSTSEASGPTVSSATKRPTIIEFPQPSRKAPGVLPPDASNERNTPSDDTERPAGFWANLQIQGESVELGA